jgi:pyridoxine 5-phosphate synthase
MKNRMIKLGVNIDHIATIRQARGTPYPDILEAARLAKAGGADQITIHLREDRRHIQDADVYLLRREIDLPLNLEMAAVQEITDIARQVLPKTVTLVPEKRQEQTTESGLNISADYDKLKKHIRSLKEKDIQVSLFIDPLVEDIRASADLEVETIEFHTGAYALALDETKIGQEMERLKTAAVLAKKAGLRVVAGHGLHYQNTRRLIQEVPEIEEVNIGHAIVARAVFIGLERAVREMKYLLV